MKDKQSASDGKPLLTKPAIIARINNTMLQLTDPSIIIEEWQHEDTGTPIYWKISNTKVGEALVASTKKGVCFLGFVNGDRSFAFSDLQRRFPASILIEEETEWQKEAFDHLNHPEQNLSVHLHLKGTSFQLNIWKRLMMIPFGGLATYKTLGSDPRIARATGAAVGANPVSYIVPCHRAVRSDGSFDRYYWGNNIKTELLAYEGDG